MLRKTSLTSLGVLEIKAKALDELQRYNEAIYKTYEASAIVGILRCYKPSNSSIYCGKYEDLQNKFSEEKRKALFQRLKSNLKSTKAAKEITTYW